MSAVASQITSLTIVYSTVDSGAYHIKHQSSASRAFARGIHRWPVNSPHKGPGTWKMFPFDGVIMYWIHHKKEALSTSLAFSDPLSKCSNAHFWYFFVDSLNKLLNNPSSWDAMALIWRHCNVLAPREEFNIWLAIPSVTITTQCKCCPHKTNHNCSYFL